MVSSTRALPELVVLEGEGGAGQRPQTRYRGGFHRSRKRLGHDSKWFGLQEGLFSYFVLKIGCNISICNITAGCIFNHWLLHTKFGSFSRSWIKAKDMIYTPFVFVHWLIGHQGRCPNRRSLVSFLISPWCLCLIHILCLFPICIFVF